MKPRRPTLTEHDWVAIAALALLGLAALFGGFN